ncbi:hypothetical protein ACFRAO_42840 [Streptomyces sp. NPDC056656]|uniref:hypothetical protein n=1 Tax=Streptomyces sp. NPDC056656 TaxID=3345895 RepID=UPI00369BC35D
MSQLLETLRPLAEGPVPGVTPELPDEVDGAVGSLLNWAAGLGLAAAVLGGLLGWAAVAVGQNSERASLAAQGKRAILWSLLGAGGIGATSALVLLFFNMTHGT